MIRHTISNLPKKFYEMSKLMKIVVRDEYSVMNVLHIREGKSLQLHCKCWRTLGGELNAA
jgi:hypothetical protein